MGRPVKILELAEDLIRLSGFEPYTDVDIVFTGVRKGEKLFEELEISGEHLLLTRHPKIFIGKIANHDRNEVEIVIDRLSHAVQGSDCYEIRRILAEFITESRLGEDEGFSH